MFRQTQIITNGTSAVYEHVLFSHSKSNFQGTFTCVVEDGYNNRINKSISLNSKCA